MVDVDDPEPWVLIQTSAPEYATEIVSNVKMKSRWDLFISGSLSERREKQSSFLILSALGQRILIQPHCTLFHPLPSSASSLIRFR